MIDFLKLNISVMTTVTRTNISRDMDIEVDIYAGTPKLRDKVTVDPLNAVPLVILIIILLQPLPAYPISYHLQLASSASLCSPLSAPSQQQLLQLQANLVRQLISSAAARTIRRVFL
ncbi:hypothetical protein MTR_6g038740 [Medicago truncatula]|uniref:Uncharacterized protein n=1 Tax=Medicago truncatula TaxID=3880 RepID=A0A072U8K0_MEDTR|nr:hypothetical protein MTR_6g038740 [Medicago truncatula]